MSDDPNPPPDRLQAALAAYGQGGVEEALARASELLTAYPASPILRNILGAILLRAGRGEEAVASYGEAARLKPDFAEAWNNRGLALMELKRAREALGDFGRAVEIRPDYANAHNNRGNALTTLGRAEEAVASYDAALALKPDYAEAHFNRGVALQGLGRLDEAVSSHDRALALKPDFTLALNQVVMLRAQMCDWTRAAGDHERLARAQGLVNAFTMLLVEDDPAWQLRRARDTVLQKYGRGAAAAFAPRGGDQGRIRVGYFSSDVHDHATMHLMAGVFEAHDRARFEIHMFSYGAPRESRARERVRAAVEVFHDVHGQTDKAIAALARGQGIDIAIDLKGFTQDGQSGIFAQRAAPVQINYLGYPGTMGADFIDYIIADRILIPEESREHYSEKIIYLPDSYQATDDKREAAEAKTTRAGVGLPETGFVFCCFNNNYKISPVEFGIWMRLLDQVEGSVLWLFKANPWAEANLRREAQARGVDPDRLVFAERLAPEAHLARQRHADLFLDTFKVNAHTTASDALWVGLPVVTLPGRSLVARVAASLLHAIGATELITDSEEAYEALALRLAKNPGELAAIRAKLEANRLTTPLFDTRRFTAHIEQAYAEVFRRYDSGLEPGPISV